MAVRPMASETRTLNVGRCAGIYAIENTVSADAYVGATVDIHMRIGSHTSLLRANAHSCKKFQSNYNEYGEEAFSWRIVEAVPRYLYTDSRGGLIRQWLAVRETFHVLLLSATLTNRKYLCNYSEVHAITAEKFARCEQAAKGIDVKLKQRPVGGFLSMIAGRPRKRIEKKKGKSHGK